MRCFLLWTHGLGELVNFITHLNTVHPNIKFTQEISDRGTLIGPDNTYQRRSAVY